MNILSLFDGMSGARIALDRAGIKVDAYFASEVDKYAIQVAQKNYPDIVHLGDVRNVTANELPHIDLLIGGSPCQGFSFAGKQLNFNDPRSALFFEYVRILKEVKPTYFLLENVKMSKRSEKVITDLLGVEPITINSALVSAQHRVRMYWTNIPDVGQPEDKGILLTDIIESGIVDREKSYCIDANYFKGGNLNRYFNKSSRQLVFGYSRKTGIQFDRGELEKAVGVLASDWRGLNRNQRQNCVVDFDSITYRKLSPVEVERLQTVKETYTDGVSNTQRYKMLGNGFTVDVIAHILRGI